MPKTTFAGHPLHPQLIVAPAGLLPASLVFDIMHAKTGNSAYADAAYYTMMGGVMGGLVAGAAGFGDYLAIAPASPVKKVAAMHGLLNVSMLTLSGVNLFLRRGKNPPEGRLPLILNAVTNTGLVFSAWLGGQMVYHYGMRVEGVSPVAKAPEIKLPGDEMMAQGFHKLEDVGLRTGL